MFTVQALTGTLVHLEPLIQDHRDNLRIAAKDERIWTNMLVDGAGLEFEKWFDDAIAEQAAGRRIAFVVRLRSDGRIVGSTSFLDIHERHQRVEIGSTWYIPEMWSTSVNPECKFLLLQHAFEVFGVNRVALITDLRNDRSQAAIAKLGAIREGVLRSHMITRGDRIRDSVVFSIVADEWPTVKARLQARLAEHLATISNS